MIPGETSAGRTLAVSVGSTVLFAIATAMPWFEIQPDSALTRAVVPVLDRENGWEVGLVWAGVPLFIGIALSLRLLAEHFDVTAGPPDWPWASIHLGGACAAAALVLVKAAVGGNALVESHADARIGLFVAMLSAVGIALGGFLYYRERVGTA